MDSIPAVRSATVSALIINLIKHFFFSGRARVPSLHSLFKFNNFVRTYIEGHWMCAPRRLFASLKCTQIDRNRHDRRNFICSALLFRSLHGNPTIPGHAMHFGCIAERCRSLESPDCLHCNYWKKKISTQIKLKGKNVSARRRSVSHGVARSSAFNHPVAHRKRKLVCHTFSFFSTSLAFSMNF